MNVAELRDLLPDVIARTAEAPEGILPALLEVMEALHAPAEAVLDDLDAHIDPRRAPDAFVPALASWVDLAWLFCDPPDDPWAASVRPFPGGVGALRELTATAAQQARRRGTAAGVIRMLETATGCRGFRIEEVVLRPDGRVEPFCVRIVAPVTAEPHLDLVRRIVDHHKPAHVVVHPVVLLEEPEPA